MRNLSKAALPLTIVAGLFATPAEAQWTGPGTWGQKSYEQFVEPGTWITVFSDASGTRVIRASAQGEVFTGTIEFWCRKDMKRGGVKFWNYFGSPLPRAPEDHPQTTEHPVWFYFDNTRFQVTLEYIPWEGVWLANGVLDPRVLEHWASSSRMEIVNMAGDTVTSFGLNQSRAAREKMHQVCGN